LLIESGEQSQEPIEPDNSWSTGNDNDVGVGDKFTRKKIAIFDID